MSGKLGMNVDLATQVTQSINGLSSGLGMIEQQVYLARSMSLNPLNFALNPGALILAPASITMAASASADLANVRQTLEYLVLKLSQEATQQAQVSNSLHPTDPGWFAQAPTARKPDEIPIFQQEWNAFLGVVNIGGNVLLARDLVEAADRWWKDIPKPVKTGIDVVLRGGKFIPWVGAGFSAITLVTEWDNDNAWGNWRNGIGLALDAASVVALVTLVPPLTPAGVVIEGALLGVGLAWDVMDIAWDLHDDGVWSWPWE